jgi:hypothetical protein
MLITVRLRMRVDLTIVGLLVLRMRWEHALLIILALSLSIILARSIRGRRAWPNAGQESLEIIGGGHFCRHALVWRPPLMIPSFEKLSEALFRESQSTGRRITKARTGNERANQR